MGINEDMTRYTAEVIREIGYDHILRGVDIQRAMKGTYGHNVTSIRPTDHCYNRVNRDIVKLVGEENSFSKVELFIYKGNSKFQCVGVNYPYDGPIYWKPIGGQETLVGQCVKGKRIIDPEFIPFFR